MQNPDGLIGRTISELHHAGTLVEALRYLPYQIVNSTARCDSKSCGHHRTGIAHEDYVAVMVIQI